MQSNQSSLNLNEIGNKIKKCKLALIVLKILLDLINLKIMNQKYIDVEVPYRAL
jgi:hypothetical protein